MLARSSIIRGRSAFSVFLKDSVQDKQLLALGGADAFTKRHHKALEKYRAMPKGAKNELVKRCRAMSPWPRKMPTKVWFSARAIGMQLRSELKPNWSSTNRHRTIPSRLRQVARTLGWVVPQRGAPTRQ